MDTVTFAGFSFDRATRILTRDGVRLALAPKAARALALLLAEPGALVSCDALRAALWPDGFVEDGNLTQTIYLVRKTLDPRRSGFTFVENVPRRGYRFVAPVALAAPRAPARRESGAAFRHAAWLVAVSVIIVSLGTFVPAHGGLAAFPDLRLIF